MDENLEFKHIIAHGSGAVDMKNMILMPYAKDITYEDGNLSLSLEFLDNTSETEIGIRIGLSDELIELFDRLLYGEE